ncbi:MAG TPA: hydroxymethylglutaryl-CoA lyase, partial [Rhodopila sp.]
RVTICEVGPRDGLQNEAGIVPAEVKVMLIEALADAGLKTVEAGSFVSPKWVPQMADTEAVLARLRPRPDVGYPVLVPNLQGLDRALACGVREVAVFGAASESFSRRNINCSIEESLARFAPLVAKTRNHGLRVRGYVSCVLGCPYEGAVSPDAVARVASALFTMGCYEVSLGDTVGTGTPLKARQLIEQVATVVPLDRISLHFHDTYGQALANIRACLDLGVSVVDSAVAGLGGCPYARGATGNLATEDVVYMLDGMGIRTGIDLPALAKAGQFISEQLNREPASRVARATAGRQNASS